jgi:glycosyltransferase involved in cell wall biosynthesis
LISAFARTVGQRDDWSLVLLSSGRVPGRLRACSDRLGVGARVHVLEVEDDDLPGLFASATLVALPNRDDAPQGASVARACASGVPLLVSDLPRLRPLVESLDVGLWAAPGDLNDWTRVLGRVVAAPEARRRWGQAGLKAAQSTFAWPRVAAQVEDVIEEAWRCLPRAQPILAPAPIEKAG